MSAPAVKKRKVKVEPAKKQFVTPVVTDEEGRRLSHTMRSTDKLQDLIRFYYAMVPTAGDGDGVFLHHGSRLLCEATPADYNLKDGDEIQFLREIEPCMFVTPVLRDSKGREFTRTMRRTDTVQSLKEYYCAMVPTLPYAEAVFLFDARFLNNGATLADLELEDGDQINVFHHQPMYCGLPPHRDLLVRNCAEDRRSSSDEHLKSRWADQFMDNVP
ncbi:uncharacterized protein LOC104582050 [Brachypodium distachyon]|uniref:uncharacterized protein LOC104582050 n=1 Tax=Brachypodium distachyon TaxID=15368 RepID=UPI00052FDC48|nr:uncharacterized protein LOC104582050 [Brachypodium distachyon]|eukprot:XP_010229634.1 uncharacterized protein LOC104582050 [Brachypodium distachyon]